MPRHRYKMALCSDTGYLICWCVHIQQTEHLSTAFKVYEPHHACVPCSIYLLDYCFVCCHCVCWHFRVTVRIYKGVNFILTPFCSVRHHFWCKHTKGLWVRKAVVCGKSGRELTKKACTQEISVQFSAQVQGWDLFTQVQAPCPNSGVGTWKKGVFT